MHICYRWADNILDVTKAIRFQPFALVSYRASVSVLLILCRIVALLENPQVLIADEEKIIVEEIKGDQTVVEEKSVLHYFLLSLY